MSSITIAVLNLGEVCPMPYALCPMPYALCPMPYALCPMPADQACTALLLRKAIFASNLTSLLATALLDLSPFDILFAQTAMPYSLLTVS
ncbi:MAG: hypothetical protein WBL95_06340 [Microcoleus sp.]